MGIVFSLELKYDLHALLDYEIGYVGAEVRKFVQEVLELVEDPANKEKASKLLLGLSTRLTANNYIALFSLLRLADDRKWIFNKVSESSVAFFEVLLILLSELSLNIYGEFEGRARMLLIALTQYTFNVAKRMKMEFAVVEAVAIPTTEEGLIETTKPVLNMEKGTYSSVNRLLASTKRALSTKKSNITQNAKTLLNEASKFVRKEKKLRNEYLKHVKDVTNDWNTDTSRAQAEEDLMKLYTAARIVHVHCSPRKSATFPRGAKYLNGIIVELDALLKQLHPLASNCFRSPGAKFFGITYNSKAIAQHDFTPNAGLMISKALMDICVARHQSTQFLDSFVEDTENIKFDFDNHLASDIQKYTCDFLNKMFTHRSKTGLYICNAMQGMEQSEVARNMAAFEGNIPVAGEADDSPDAVTAEYHWAVTVATTDDALSDNTSKVTSFMEDVWKIFTVVTEDGGVTENRWDSGDKYQMLLATETLIVFWQKTMETMLKDGVL